MIDVRVLRALASERRLQILDWLKDPQTHFRPQKVGCLEEDGVCVIVIAEKLGVAQPTATTHLQMLADAGLIRAKRVQQWTFYKREEEAIEALKARFQASI